ncbi:hypothetical protein LCGC14_2918640, partial [marine sediment metagenome]
DNTGAFYDGGEIITVSNFPDIDKIISPDTLKNLTITNTNLSYYDGTRTRFVFSSSNTIFYSPDGTNNLDVNNGLTTFVGDVTFSDDVAFNDNVLITSDDLNPSFNIVGNGEAFRIQQAQGVNGFFMTWYDNNSVRMSYYGHGQSSNQQHLWLVNEMTDGNLILDSPGIVDVQTGFMADDYYSGDGTQGYTGSCGSGTTLTIKDGLITGCS